MEPLNVRDYEALAVECLEPGVHGFFAGGANDEVTLADNLAAFRRTRLRPRVLVDVASPSTRTTVLGQEIELPVLIAPVAYQRLAHPDGECGMARASASAGTVMCLSTRATVTWDEICATGAKLWFQLYVAADPGVTASLVEQARERGFGAIVLTVDTPILGRRERDHRNGFSIPPELTRGTLGEGDLIPLGAAGALSASLTWSFVEELVAEAGLPVVLKGIMTAEDAHLACEHGVAGIVVSNHGGRQLDGVCATLDALPEVVGACDGRAEILVDGGVRRGTDVVKALALGARAVLVGRPTLWGLAVGGEAGARRVLELLRDEVELALQLTGCPGPAEVTPGHVARGLPS